MVGKIQKEVHKHINGKKLNKYINKLEKEASVLRKLYFIRYLYKGKKIDVACKKCGITLPTGHNWLDKWNEEGYDGLYPKYFNGGRPSKLSPEDKEKFNKILEKEDYLTTKKVSKILKDEFNIEYSISQQSIVLKSLGFHL
ncbi:MAG: helix-turn-helix domain-containing protein [Methanobrevibacter sp.]|jgi:transposase|nr:helix-turn-helix domain-containing protein [Candidatus Methanovirga aequatorialis]